MMTFRLHRTGVILVALGALLLGVLLFMAGCLVGQRRAAAPRAGGPSLPAPAAAPSVKPPAVKAPAAPALRAPAGPAMPGTPQAAAAVPAAPEAFALRAGAFTDEAEAKALAEELAGLGLQATITKVPTSGGAVLHTVLAGRYASREEAAAVAAELARREGLSVAVVAAGKAR